MTLCRLYQLWPAYICTYKTLSLQVSVFNWCSTLADRRAALRTAVASPSIISFTPIASLSIYGILAQYFISWIIYKIWCQYRNSFSTLFLLWTGPLFWFSAPNPSGSLIFSLRQFQFITFSALLSLFQVRFLFFCSLDASVWRALLSTPPCAFL